MHKAKASMDVTTKFIRAEGGNPFKISLKKIMGGNGGKYSIEGFAKRKRNKDWGDGSDGIIGGIEERKGGKEKKVELSEKSTKFFVSSGFGSRTRLNSEEKKETNNSTTKVSKFNTSGVNLPKRGCSLPNFRRGTISPSKILKEDHYSRKNLESTEENPFPRFNQTLTMLYEDTIINDLVSSISQGGKRVTLAEPRPSTTAPSKGRNLRLSLKQRSMSSVQNDTSMQNHSNRSPSIPSPNKPSPFKSITKKSFKKLESWQHKSEHDLYRNTTISSHPPIHMENIEGYTENELLAMTLPSFYDEKMQRDRVIVPKKKGFEMPYRPWKHYATGVSGHEYDLNTYKVQKDIEERSKKRIEFNDFISQLGITKIQCMGIAKDMHFHFQAQEKELHRSRYLYLADKKRPKEILMCFKGLVKKCLYKIMTFRLTRKQVPIFLTSRLRTYQLFHKTVFSTQKPRSYFA